MAIVLDDPFDSLTGWTNTGTAVISSAQSFESGNSLLIDATGSAKHVQKANAGAARLVVVRIYYRIETDASASASIVQMSNTAGNLLLQARPGRKIRPFINATAGTDSAALNLNQWYRLDILFDASANPAAITWQIDGVAQTGQTGAQTATNFGNLLIGNTASNTYKIFFDALKTANTSGEYPIGSDTPPATNALAGAATGTGAAASASISEKPNAGVAAGTGVAANITTNEQTSAAAATGTGAAGSASISEQPNAGAATGTGAALNATAVNDVKAFAGAATGTGSASGPSESVAAAIGNAAGVGIAYNTSIAIDDTGIAESALATGSAFNATVKVSVGAQPALGTGQAAFAVESDLHVGAAPAVGTGTSSGAIAAVPNVFASVASGTGAAYNPAISIKSPAGAALGAFTTGGGVFDSFGRTVVTGLGNTDTGDAWVTAGIAADYSVDGDLAQFRHSNNNQARRAWIPSLVRVNTDQYILFKAPAPDPLGYHDLFIRLRQTSVDGDCRMVRIRLYNNGDVTEIQKFDLMRRAIGIETVLASAPALPYTFVPDALYTVKIRLLGQGMFAMIYKQTVPEPTDWQVSAEDQQLTAPGGIGLATYSPAGTYPFSISWEDLESREIVGQSTAYDATTIQQVLVYANPEAASGIGEAFDATCKVSTLSQAAIGVGSSYNSPAAVAASADYAFGTGEAFGMTASMAATADVATGVGSVPTMIPYVAPTPEVAEGFGSSFDTESEASGINPGVATGTGQAFNPSIAIRVNVQVVTGVGTAYAPTTVKSANATAGIATGTGISRSITAKIATSGGHASGVGIAYDPTTIKLTFASAGAATGVGTAFNPTTLKLIVALAGAATGTGAAFDAAIVGYSNLVTEFGDTWDEFESTQDAFGSTRTE